LESKFEQRFVFIEEALLENTRQIQALQQDVRVLQGDVRVLQADVRGLQENVQGLNHRFDAHERSHA